MNKNEGEEKKRVNRKREGGRNYRRAGRRNSGREKWKRGVGREIKGRIG